ncbi:hypothetical protein BDY19DRAFT_941997 [Irpex rosettiformis]|uniref:Uncharacterized protein n=1 Tax=Irpex rosettiformis TaxID=378272 RepID=A0ACB8U753_9APHY|nr:hypothetical protein BDY19DRAFT_941997 [Irpex rosettiformis]
MSSRQESSESSSSMGPDHSAIVLSGNPAAPEPTPVTGGSATPADPVLPSRDTSLFQPFGDQGRLEELDNSMPRPRVLLHRTTSSASNPSGPRPPVHWSLHSVARPVRSTNASTSSTDASTSLGRRVEARASAARMASNDHLRSDVREFMDAADTSLALLAHQQRQLLVSSRDFRQDSTIASTETAGSSSAANGLFMASTVDPPTSGRWFARDRAALWRQNMRERRPRDPDGNAGVLISFRATQGDQPTVIVRSRRGNATEMPELEDETDDPANRRSYRIRRRLNPEGSMESLGSRTSDAAEDYDEDFPRRTRHRLAALSPARIWPDTPTRESEESMDNEQDGFRSYYLWSSLADRRLPPPAPALRRRRGWARLDADGNEIPTDEEEEYERSRTHMRVRAQALTSRRPNRFADARRASLETTTLPPAPPPLSDDWGYTYPSLPQTLPLMAPTIERSTSPVFRARLGSQESLSSDASTITVNHDFPEQEAPVISSPSFQPSPLPWGPLEFTSPASQSSHMQQKGATPSPFKRCSLSWAPFAGR